MTRTGRRLVAVALAVLVVAVYAPVLDFEFVTFDDPEYVTQNRRVHEGLGWSGIVWAFTRAHAANWHPLTWLSHMADWSLFGAWAGGHHATSVILHALTAAVLFLALVRLTAAPARSAFAAGLFALHPLRVESVAWVSERKDVLAGLWWVTAMLCYAGWAARPTVARYAAVVAAVTASLLAKPMAVTLPAALVLLDVWPLGRVAGVGWRRVLGEKVPLFVLAGAVGLVTYHVQSAAGAVASLEGVPAGLRVANAVIAYAAYVGKTVWPTRLAVFYPPLIEVPTGVFVVSLLVLLGVTAFVWHQRRRRAYLLVGWLWFLGTLVPVIGLVRAGDQAMADRFTYLPSIGLGVMSAWALGEAAGRWPRVVATAAVVTLVGCVAVTRMQLVAWRDSRSLYLHALAVTTGNHLAHQNLGLLLLDEGRLDEALAHFDAAVAARPTAPKPHLNRGVGLAALGRSAEAIREHQIAIGIDAGYAAARYNLGVELAKVGRTDEALAAYAEAIRLDPEYALPHVNAGLLLAERGRVPEAIAHYRRALALDHRLVAAYNNLAVALERAGKGDEAIAAYRGAIEVAPRDPRPRFNLGAALSGQGRAPEAVEAYREVLRLDPSIAEAHAALGDALAAMGDGEGARRAYRDALARRGDWPEVAARLAALEAGASDGDR